MLARGEREEKGQWESWLDLICGGPFVVFPIKIILISIIFSLVINRKIRENERCTPHGDREGGMHFSLKNYLFNDLK